MASLYCQELIRNTKVLCESYIGELYQKTQVEEAELKDDEEQGKRLNDNYYLEDDKKLLDLLIKNCLPILTDLLSQVDNFNKYNGFFSKKEALSEFDQNLKDLVENKAQFAIYKEAQANLKRFKVFERENGAIADRKM